MFASNYPRKLNLIPLIYPENNNSYKNVLFIDNSVENYQTFVDSVNSDTFPIVYSAGSSKTDLLALLKTKFTSIDRIAFVFISSLHKTKKFLDSKPFFENKGDSENLTFLISVIKEFAIKNIDFLACETLKYKNWVNYYTTLTKETGIIVGASNDKTGNIKYGGDWVMENTSENVELIYFTKSIEYYSYLLDYITFWATENLDYPSQMVNYDGYMYVGNWSSNTIIKISLTDPSDNQTWVTTPYPISSLTIYNGYLYVSNYFNGGIGQISLTDPSTDYNFNWAVTGDNNPIGLAIYDGYLYVAIENIDSILKINLLTGSSEVFADTGNFPQYLIIHDGYIYVTNYDDSTIGQISLTRPDISNNQGWASTGYNPEGLGIYDGYIYVANYDDYTIGKISLTDPNGDNNQYWLETHDAPLCILISNSYMYYDMPDYNIISRYYMLDIPDWTSTGNYAVDLVISGGYIYVSNNNDDTISKISLSDPSGDSNLSWVPNCKTPHGLDIYGDYIYVANGYDGTIGKISLIDPSGDNNQSWAATENSNIRGIKIDSSGEYIYVASAGASSITRIKLNDPNSIVNNWAITGTYPTGLVIDGDYIYVSNQNSSTIGRISLTDPSGNNNQDWVTFPIVYTPSGLLIINGYMYVMNSNDYSIAKINLIDPMINSLWTNTLYYSYGIKCDNSYLYTANTYYNNISRFVLSPHADICFPSKTPIQTDQGIIAIEKINPSIHTINNKKIVHITKTISKDEYLVCFKKDSLGPNYPSADTTMSKEHKVYYAGKMTEAGELMDGIKVEYNGEILYNILMEEYSQIVVNNLICETLHPDNIVSKMYMGKKTVPKKRNIAKLYKFASISR